MDIGSVHFVIYKPGWKGKKSFPRFFVAPGENSHVVGQNYIFTECTRTKKYLTLRFPGAYSYKKKPVCFVMHSQNVKKIRATPFVTRWRGVWSHTSAVQGGGRHRLQLHRSSLRGGDASRSQDSAQTGTGEQFLGSRTIYSGSIFRFSMGGGGYANTFWGENMKRGKRKREKCERKGREDKRKRRKWSYRGNKWKRGKN